MQAEQFIRMGYQRILTFERPGGGFDWWGSGPPLVWLTAYGVQQLVATSKVMEIDKGIINRARGFLARKQSKDGSWNVVGSTHSETIARVKSPALALTAYVTWTLAEAGDTGPAVQKGLAYLRKHRQEAAGKAYHLSLLANAFAYGAPKDPMTKDILDELEKIKTEKDNLVYWTTTGQTATSAYGNAAHVETTAMVVLAMLQSGQYANTINKALGYIIKNRYGTGTWGGTQATILALKCLVASEVRKTQGCEARVVVLLNGEKVGTWGIYDDNREVMQMVDFKGKTKVGKNKISFEVSGNANVMYQVVSRFYTPHKKEGPAKKAIDIDIAYDRTTLHKDDTIMATATMRYNGQHPTYMVILDLGIPPGFSLDPGDFAELLGQKKIEKFSITSRQITLYLGEVKPGMVFTCRYQLKAKYPLKVKTPKSTAYEYYTPSSRGESKPVDLEVKGK